MNLANVWKIVWQDTPFHWAIAGVLVFAIVIELCTFLEYVYLKCRKTAKAIDNLNNPDKEEVPYWKNKHLKINEQGEPKKSDDEKFILIKYPTVLARRTPRSHMRFVTTLCTSIGVLGTFYGIQQGLQGLNLDIANSQQLMASSIELLKSMKTAFSTSLMGLGCGSLFTLVLFVTDLLRRQRRNGLRDKLDKLAIFETAENDNQNLIQEIQQLRQSLTNQQSPSAEAIGEAVGRRIAEQFTGVNQLTSEAIGEAVGQQMQSVITPELQKMLQEQRRLTKQLEENQGHKVIEKLIKDLKDEVIKPVAQRLDESAKLTRRASEAVESLHNELGGISQSLAGSIETIQNFQQETLVELQNFANNLGQTLNQFQNDTTGVLEQTAQQINSAVEQSIVGMTAQREAFQESANQAAVTFRGIRGELEQALNSQTQQQQEMLQRFGSGIVQLINRTTTVFETQNNTLERVGNEASGLMNDASNNLLATLGHIDQTLTVTRQTVQDDLTRFQEEYQTNLQTFFERQNNLLEETLGQQRDGLSEVVTNLNTVFQDEYNRRSELAQQVNQSMNQVSTAATEVNKLVCAVGLNSSTSLVQQEKIACELNQISRNLNQQVQGVEKKYEELSNAFKYSLDTWTNHFDKSQDKYFKAADSSMANVCSSLLQTANVLVAANDNRNNGNGSNYHG